MAVYRPDDADFAVPQHCGSCGAGFSAATACHKRFTAWHLLQLDPSRSCNTKHMQLDPKSSRDTKDMLCSRWCACTCPSTKRTGAAPSAAPAKGLLAVPLLRHLRTQCLLRIRSASQRVHPVPQSRQPLHAAATDDRQRATVQGLGRQACVSHQRHRSRREGARAWSRRRGPQSRRSRGFRSAAAPPTARTIRTGVTGSDEGAEPAA
jgi:hypothetical protein